MGAHACARPALAGACRSRPARAADAAVRSTALLAPQLKQQSVLERLRLPAAKAPSRGRRHVCRAAASDGASRRTARELKKLLETLGVDTSDCFERADLEAKWAMLSDAQRATAEAGGDAAPRKEAQADASASTSSSGSTASGAGADPWAWAASMLEAPKEQVKRLQTMLEEQQRAVTSGAAWTGVRQRLDELDESWGVSTKARIASQRVRDAARKLDASLGVSATARAKGPALWAAFNEARATPAGQLVSFAFTVWLFLSGAFWTLLSWLFLAVFVLNLVAPLLLRGFLDDLVADAAQQAGAPPGSGPRGGPGAGAGANARRDAGSAYAGGASARGPDGRRDLSGAGPIVDVDADVKDV